MCCELTCLILSDLVWSGGEEKSRAESMAEKREN